jgi:hypothetical protein
MHHEEFEKNFQLHNEKLFEKKLMIGMNKNDESINFNIENNIVDLNINNNNNIINIHNKKQKIIEKNIEKMLNKNNVFISFPLDVSRFFLNNWLEIKNICFLDNAFCNKQHRLDFLNILNGCVIGSEISNNFTASTDLYLNWILKRNIFITNLYVNKWNISISQYFEINDNNRNLFLKSLKFDFLYSNNFENFNENTLIQFFSSNNLKNLNELYFRAKYFFESIITDDFLFTIANNFLNLKRLNLNNCCQITDEGLI